MIYTETHGQGPDLVFLHGWGLHSGIWQLVVDLLKNDYRLTLVDLPGHGRSQPLKNGYRLETLAEALLPVLPDRAMWIGWSLGGLVATKVAAQYPDRIKGLINVASSPCLVEQEKWPGMNADTIRSFANELAKNYRETLTRFLGLQVMMCENQKILLREMQAILFSVDDPVQDALMGCLDTLIETDLRHEAANLRCPLLYILGRLDSLVPSNVSEPLQNMAEVVVIPQAGHAPFLSHPDKFSQLLREFVERHEA